MGTELVPDIFDSEFSSLGNTGGIQDAVADPLGLGDWAQHPNAPAIAHPSPNQQNRPPYSQPFQNASAYSAGSQRPRSDWEKTPQELAREHFERTSRTMTRKEQEAKASGDDEGGWFSMERGILNRGVIAGVLCMVGAVVWFVLGLQAGVIFFYPPVLFIVGLTAAVRGIISTVD